MDLSALRTLSRQKADEETTSYISNSEADSYLNEGLKVIYGKIAQRFENFFIVKGSNGSAFTTFATTDVNTATEEITVNRSFQTGDPVRLKTTGTIPAGLAVATNYYVIRVSSTVIKLATTQANADAGTAIDITSVGAGTHSIGNSGAFDTVVNVQEYNLPADMLKLVRTEHRRSGSSNEDDWLNLRTLNIGNDSVRAFYPPREGWGPGPGFGYFVAGNKLFLRPTPVQAFSMRLWYVPRVVLMSATTDVPGIPEEYHDLIAEYAAIQMLSKSGEGLFVERQKSFEFQMQNMIENIEIRNQQSEQMLITDEYDFDIVGFGPT